MPSQKTLSSKSFFRAWFGNGLHANSQKNIRSIKAAEKLPYAVIANETRKSLYDQINHEGDIYDLYEIPKDLYTFHILRQHDDDEQQLLEA